MTDLTTENVNPVHMVCYYRYFRSSHRRVLLQNVAAQARVRREDVRDRRASAVDPNMYYGWYSIADVDGEEGSDESRLHLGARPSRGSPAAAARLPLACGSAAFHAPGREQPAGFRQARGRGRVRASAADGGGVEEIDDPEMAYRRSCGINVSVTWATRECGELSGG